MNRTHLVLALGLALTPSWSMAADHIDGPEAVATPSADIADYFAWMSDDAETLNLVMTVAPFSNEDATFSDALVYVFHVASTDSYGGEERHTEILCSFTRDREVECWMGDDYASGKTDDSIRSADGSFRVFAGLRNDPFFFEFAGFNETVAAVVAAAPNLTFDEHGCPDVDSETSASLVNQLASGKDAAPASDGLATSNVLAIVVSVDASSIDSGGPLVATWASTHTLR